MTDAYGWDFRQLYEQPPPEMLDPEAFFSAFSAIHNINGQDINCILAKSNDQSVKLYSQGGIHCSSNVLIVNGNVKGVETGASIRVDGNPFLIIRVSSPILGLTRIELEGYSG